MERFIVLDVEDRNNFEKKFQIPFGYGSLPIFYKFESAYNHLKSSNDSERLSIEKLTDWGREIVFEGSTL